ncbi:MAG: hypothetical protein GMKNLPBB_02220 [Myxococcota bacterium]|nr:hypothetical protein [Myxococcota bacterium]
MFPNQGEYRIGLGVCMSMQGEKAAAQQLIATADRKQRSEGMERMLRLIGEIK